MDNQHEVASIELSIRKVENGFVVEVAYPKQMLPDPIMDTANSIVATLSSTEKKIAAGTGNPMDAFTEMFNKLKKPNKPLRKPIEEYIFQDMDKMMNFIRETFTEEQQPKV
jgi:hypothetical protein